MKSDNILNRILFSGLIFLTAFVPLYPKIPSINISGTYVAIRIEDFIILAILIIFLAFILISGKLKDFLALRLNRLIILFFGIGLISLFSGLFITQTITLNLSFLHFLRRVEFMILLPIAYFTFRSKKDIHLFLIVFCLTIFLVNLYALGQQYLDFPVISTTNSEFAKGLILELTPGARVNSTFAGHYDLAVFLVMALILLSSLFFLFKKIYLKLLSLILASLSFFILVLTAARVSYIAVMIGVILNLFLLKQKKYIILIAILALAAVIYPSQLRDRFISTININLFQSGQRYSSRNELQEERSKLNIPSLKINYSSESAGFASASAGVSPDIVPGEPVDSTQLGVYRSFAIRLDQEWPRALRAFLKNPLLGTGYSSLGISTDNDLLRLLGEVGLFGTAAFGLIIIEITKILKRLINSWQRFQRILAAAGLSILGAFIINGLFIDVFESSKVATLIWLMMGIFISMEKYES